MTRYHTEEEIRRYDLMKLGVLLLLLLLLALAWVATRDAMDEDLLAGEPAGTLESGGEIETGLPFPELAIPSIGAATGSGTPGSVTLSGSAGQGAQLVILVDGQPAGAAVAGADGSWQTTVEIPEGDHTVQVQTVDNVGNVVASSLPVDVTVSGAGVSTTAFSVDPPRFDPLTGTYLFGGTAAPNSRISIAVDGAVVGSAVAGPDGRFSVPVLADRAAGNVEVQLANADGSMSAQPGLPVPDTRPPSLNPSAAMTFDPMTGALVIAALPADFAFSGRGVPGTQVELLVDEVRAGVATIGPDGAWSLPVALADGPHTVQLNALDAGGAMLSAAAPVAVIVGDSAAAGGAPPEPGAGEQTLASVLAGRPEFSTFYALAQTAGLTETLAGVEPLTLFAPTDDALGRLPQRVIDGLTANPQALANVLQYHAARGRFLIGELPPGPLATLNGMALTIAPQVDSPAVNEALVVEADIDAGSGLVHAIDRLLTPPLPEGMAPPVIDSSGVATFEGTFLTVVGTAAPNQTILVAMNGEPFGQPATVGPEGTWAISGDVAPGEYQIVAYMLDAAGVLLAQSSPVLLTVR